MSKVEMLRAVVSERLTAAAVEIFGHFERTIAEYEEELRRCREDNERHRKLLDAVLKPEVRLHRAGVQQDTEPPRAKEEEEQLWSRQEGEQLQGPVPVKTDDVKEEAQSSHLHHRQNEENREAEAPAGSSLQQIETESDEEDCGGSEATKSLDPDSRPANDDETPESVKLKGTQTARDDGTSDCSGPETENRADDWKETRKPTSDLKALAKNGIPAPGRKHSSDKKSYSCSECGKTFELKKYSQKNRKSLLEDKPLVCSLCDERATQSVLFITHKSTHSGETSFKCSVCNRHFGHKGDAVRHIRTHTGEKPFSCSVCGKRFTQSTAVGLHMRTHTGERPFGCSLCPKRFRQRGILTRHMRVHTGEKPYSCSVCSTTFSLSQSLSKHMRIHTGEKPFSCSVCDKKFTQKGNMTQHMTLHTREKSFSCHLCGKTFTRKFCVKRHKCVTESSGTK
ncbi:gastrula zinc finger protein XlCGF57.1-like [Plectropomus leopardus]|uniref:gastrula zinc finger protein XlCGF57.1-like n=1 Tax=Plectropomus leopardus TaxID=160734 RepID=UPI001C4CAA8C|nr:gastrula zinc finger protein XlCGF57.1-like [Plectropomus leopardus]